MIKISTFACLVLLLLCLKDATALESKSRVGVSIALSGPLGIIGTTMKNAIILAQDDFDSDKSVLFIFEDDAFQPKNTVSIVNKFISTDRVDVVVVFGATTSLSVADITEKAKIPLVGITVLETLEKNRNYAVRFLSSTKDLGIKTAIEMKKRGYQKIAMASSIQDATLTLRDHVVENGEFDIVVNDEFLPSDLDFRSSILKMKSNNPDAIFLSLLPPQGSTFAKQLRESGFTGQIVGSLQMGSPSEIKLADSALNGTWIVTGDDRKIGDFVSRYKKRFPDSDPFSEAVYVYDLTKMLIEAVKGGAAKDGVVKDVAIKREQINSYLHNVKDFNGALGVYGSDGKGSFTFGVVGKVITSDGFEYFD